MGPSFAAKAYARVGVETGVHAANPVKLVLMLYDGALLAIAEATRHMAEGRIADKGKAISKAISIIDGGLRVSLDPTRGGAIAAQLFELYEYMGRRLLLARDHLGIKPLYVARSSDPDSGWSIAFASELRALLASGLLGTPRLDPQAVASSVWNGFVVGAGTAVKGVELLWPGQLLEFDGSGKQVRQEDFWRIPDRAPGYSRYTRNTA